LPAPAWQNSNIRLFTCVLQDACDESEALLLRPEDTEKLRGLFDETVAERPIADEDQANAVLAAYPSLQQASDRLFDLLVTVENTGNGRGLILDLANHFSLADVIDGSSRHIAEALSNLAACIPGVAQPDGRKIESRPLRQGEPPPQHVAAYVRSLDCKEVWKEALLIARASSVLGRFPFSNARTKAVAAAATRMKQRGYLFTLDSGAFRMQPPEIEKIVADIENSLRQLGCFDALANITHLSLNAYDYAYEQILFGQKYASGLGERPPTIPIGLLFNIAVKLPIQAHGSSNRPAAWDRAVSLARDFAAMLDLEAYTHFAFLSADASQLEAKLRQVAHYDHCFALRQWHFSFTPEFLTTFFGPDFDSDMKQRLGWSVSDAAQFSRVLTGCATQKPTVIPTDALVMAGMDRALVHSMLPYFTHSECEANKNYRSPFDTAGPDVIFKPAILFKRQFLVLPPASLLGPALFEATFAALKSISPDPVIAKLRGDGTERLAYHVFGKRGFRPSFENAEYDLGPAEKGECDLIFEDEQNIIFVECKAKALTRGAMTGAQGDALLDFAGGLFASQAQALKHERILWSLGAITFLDGRRLEFRDRRITRLTVTLADHGTLQNRWMLNMVYQALLSVRVTCSPDYPKKKQVNDFNANLQMFQEETRLLLATGHGPRAHALNLASTSVAQLDVILNGAKSLGDVRERLTFPVNFSTLNVLLEHFNMEKMPGRA
jgi:hypothetical protein